MDNEKLSSENSDINNNEVSDDAGNILAPRPHLTEGFDAETEKRISEATPYNDSSGLVAVSKYISAIFSPLLMPTYCMAMAMWLTPLSMIPENTRLSSSLVILFLTGIIPMAMILGLIKTGHVSNLDISNRRQRLIPLVATSLCYLAASIYLHRIQAPDWLCMLFIGALGAGFIATVVSIWWKISVHATAAGALVGLLVRFSVSELNIVPILPWIVGAILLGGLIGVSRVVLNAHTPGQFVAGELLGGLCIYFATGLPLPFVANHILPLS